VASLEKQKFAVTERPRRRDTQPRSSTKGAPTASVLSELDESSAKDALGGTRETTPSPSESPKSRHIPAAVRRAVYERDGARCTYVDERGERCQETHYLELHHRQPFGMQGAHSIANLTLYCGAHNALAAEVDFGRAHMTDRQQSSRHESRRLVMRTIDEPDRIER
jgi:hypothetical protein